jgi:hypothetical protein
MLGMAIPEQYGGSGIDDYRYNVVLQEEAARALVTLSTVRTQLDVILPYFLHYANDEHRERWFPVLAAGTLLTAVAMTEPGTGSDLAGVRSTAVRDGDEYVLNGAKTFITTVAVAADLFGSDERVRRGVLEALDQGLTEVTLWGDHCPAELDQNVDPVQHRLSAAARAFKAQALAAAAAPRPFPSDIPKRSAAV